MRAPPEISGITHDEVPVGALRMHVATAGPPGGPAVLLVHGWPQNWWVWREVIPSLAGTHRVIAPDLRGFGWSDKPRGRYAKDELAGDLLALIEVLGLERVTWVGHDWGAYCGFLAALRAPERIERMLALAIPHPWARPTPRLLAVFASYQVPVGLPALGSRLASPIARRIIQAGRGADRLTPEEVATYVDPIPPHVAVALYRTSFTRELPAVARGRFEHERLTVPTTLMVGSRDLVTTGLGAGPVAGQPSLTVEVLEGAAHWLPEQRPREIVDWVQGVRP